MARIELNQDRLTVHVQGLDRLLALRRRLDIEYDHIVSVEPLGAKSAPRGPMAWEAFLPAAIAPRTFYQHGGRGPVGARRSEQALVIGLYGERYARVVIEVEDPQRTADANRIAVRGGGTDQIARLQDSGNGTRAPKTRVETRTPTRAGGLARPAVG